MTEDSAVQKVKFYQTGTHTIGNRLMNERFFKFLGRVTVKTETFTDDAEANQYLRREQRQEFAIPDVV